jgi:hypothetical protein
MICSNMKINFVDGKIDNFSAYVKPDAQFVPPHEIKPEVEKLKGFNWRGKERPVREDVVKTRGGPPKKQPIPKKGSAQRMP